MEIIAIFIYLLVMFMSPGPNNLILASYGVNFGVYRTLPAIMGSSLGVSVQAGIISIFLSKMTGWIAGIRFWIAVLGGLYLLWLCCKMLKQTKMQDLKKGHHTMPMRFLASVAFNWLNPKAWVIGLNTALMLKPERISIVGASCLCAILTFLIALPSFSLWTAGGAVIRRFLSSPAHLRLFNYIMALTLFIITLWLFPYSGQ